MVPRRAGAAQAEAIEQQTTVTQEVILVPRNVLVPFVQTNTFGAVRLGQAQVVGAAGTSAIVGAAGVQAAGVQGATGVAAQSTTGVSQAELERATAVIERLERRVQELELQLRQQQPLFPPR